MVKEKFKKYQIKWLESRKKLCKLKFKSNDKDTWFIYILNSSERVDCVYQTTTKRVDTLNTELTFIQDNLLTETVTKSKEHWPRITNVPAVPEDFYFSRSRKSYLSGRYYFEVIIEQGNITAEPIETIVLAKITDGESSVAETSFSIRPKNLLIETEEGGAINFAGGNIAGIKLPRVVLGIAADFNNGKVYFQKNGEWLSGSPGGAGGTNIPSNKKYMAEVVTSGQMSKLRKAGIIDINFGDRPFELNPPEGYLGFDTQASGDTHLYVSNQVRVFGPNTYIQGKSQHHWVREYWKWARSFKGESPSSDLTGQLCANKQTPPVWFLTGSFQSGAITRKCKIPVNAIVLIPLINVLAQINPGTTETCDNLVQTVGRASEDISGLSLLIDGNSVPVPARYLKNTDCFKLNDISRDVNGMAVGAGYFAFIQLTKKGNYDIHFQGTNNVLGFSQDVRYLLETD